MKDRKIKLFLGAYVNFPNAQNINCDNIARYIDKDKFEVHTMYSDKLPIDKEKYKTLGVRLHRLIHHRFIWYWCKLFTMLFGNYDVYYLPKMEQADRHIARLMRGRKTFVASIEGVVGEQIRETDIAARSYFDQMDGVFSISKCIQNSAEKIWDMKTPVLYLGADPPKDLCERKENVRHIIWVGSIIDRKRPDLMLEIAKAFPTLSITMIGDGDRISTIKEQISDNKIQNIELTGRIPNEEVYSKLKTADLLLMTSEYEGLPKVIQEAAVCFVPSIYIGEHYTVDFIEDGVNGYKVLSLDEMKERIRYLLDNPSEFQAMSNAANELIQPYLWPTLIKEYEDYFIKIYAEKTERV